MSAVLDIDNLLESPLADLHAIAGELDIEGYRLLGKSDLTVAILESRGANGSEIRPAVEAKAGELAEAKAAREKELAEREAAEAEAREAARAEAAAERARQPRGGSDRSGRGRRGGGQQQQRRGDGRKPRGRKDSEGQQAAPKGDAKGEVKAEPRKQEPTTPLAGVFEPGSGGGGRLRTDLSRRVRGDADIPRGEVRRWNLKRGDLIEAQVRKAKRGRTDFVVGSIDSVNGADQEARKQPTTAFEQRDAAPVAGNYSKRLFKHAPVGAGSRVIVTGPTRAAASEMLKKLSGEIASAGVVTTLVIVSARPEQDEAVSGVEVILGDATKGPERVLGALDLALDRDRRLAESGRATALLVDGLDLFDGERASEILSSARNLADGGSLTIVASAGSGSALEAQATAIGVVAGGRKLKLDKKSSWSAK